MFERGEETGKDNLEAYLWYTMAANQNFSDTAQKAAAVAKKMNPDDLQTAKNKVRAQGSSLI